MKLRGDFGRRAFLRGAGGLLIALPMLEFTHGRAWAAGGTPAKRLIIVFRHGGTVSNVTSTDVNKVSDRLDGTENEQGYNYWIPTGDQLTPSTVAPIHKIFSQAQLDKINILSAVDNAAGVIQSPYLGSHGWANVSILTSAQVEDHDTYQTSLGPSLDQYVAAKLAVANPTPFNSVNLMVDGHQYGTPFFQSARQPVQSETNPGKAFNTYFGGVSSGKPNPDLVRRQAMGISILDGSMDGYKSLQSKVSAQDRQVIDAHLTHLSELEQRIKALQTAVCTPPSINKAIQDGDQEHVGPLMAQMIVSAMACGLTNVATLELADIITPWLGENFGKVGYDIGHSLHHVARDAGATGEYYPKQAAWLAEMLSNRQWCMGLYKQIFEGLEAIPEGSGTMLDNTIMLYTSEFSNGSLHSENDMPLMLAGGTNYFKTGRHINCNVAKNPNQYQTRTGTHNVYTSVLNGLGIPDTHFGWDSPSMVYKGPLATLTT